MVFLKNQKKNNCMITETTIYYDKRKKDINAYCFEMALFRSAFFVFYGPLSFSIFLYCLIVFLIERNNPVFLIFMLTGLIGFVFSAFYFMFVFLMNKKYMKLLFTQNDVVNFSITVKSSRFILLNHNLGKSFSFALNDIKSVEYHKKTIIIKVINKELRSFIIFPNLRSLKSIFVNNKKD